MNCFRTCLTCIITCYYLNLHAQLTFDIKGILNDKISKNYETGQEVTLLGIEHLGNVDISPKAVIYSDGVPAEEVSMNDLSKINFQPKTTEEFWKSVILIYDVYNNIDKEGMQYKLRQEAADEAIDYINTVRSKNLIFNDAYLESYLYAYIYKIYPSKIEDGRPGILNVQILKDPTPNAFIFPNGSLFITSGMLSTINSEEELIGILAHEVAHFVLDHQIININKEAQRQRRAEFWTAMTAILAASADVYLSSKNDYHVPGTLTMGSALLTYSIATAINERLGLKFSREQELQADECTALLMNFIHLEKNALASALSKIKSHNINKGNYIAISGEGAHPAIDNRIAVLGGVKEYNDPIYDVHISFINTFNAYAELNNQNFEKAMDLAERNHKADAATEDDYLIMAIATLNMFNTPAKNQYALELLYKASTMNQWPNVNSDKYRSIALIRLNKNDLAKSNLKRYEEKIQSLVDDLFKIKNEAIWAQQKGYLNAELKWARKMIGKVSKL